MGVVIVTMQLCPLLGSRLRQHNGDSASQLDVKLIGNINFLIARSLCLGAQSVLRCKLFYMLNLHGLLSASEVSKPFY